MADFLERSAVPLLLLLLLSSSSPLPSPIAAARPSLVGAGQRYESIFSFGDSYTDNNPVAFAWYGIPDLDTRPPYGSTFLGRPTGRCCDGRLVIDFIAERLGLPLVPPFLAHGDCGSLRRGANFAVGSATALDASFFHHDGDSLFPINVSLSVQLQWFESLKPSLCATPKECQEVFDSSLFLVGELGFNDYSFSSASTRSKSVQQARSLVPDVVGTISMAIERLIEHGAKHLLVSGMVPAGCGAVVTRPVRRRRRGKLRPPDRVPEGDERAVRPPQHAVAGVPREDPGPPPGRGRRLRRPLQLRHGDGGVAGKIWVPRGCSSRMLWRAGEVPLQRGNLLRRSAR